MAGQEFGFYFGELVDGRFIVCSEREPIFCFLRDTEEEALRVAQETFVEYHRQFFQKEAKVQVRPLVDVPVVPVHRISSGRAYALQVAYV